MAKAKKKTKNISSKKASNKKTVAKKKVARRPAGANKAVSPVRGSASNGASSVGIRPLGDRVVIRPLSEEETGTKSAFGIIIPDTVKGEKPEQGVVVATGPGKYDDGEYVPMQVSVGDRVVFSKYGYDEVKVGGKEYYVLSESSVLAVIRD
ncbi:co-chaperone GroES [Candidatus Kaiserbacteria bacterium]|nr:co-chaperone GroES [Candidatus Kaiserbacteria bacterium]